MANYEAGNAFLPDGTVTEPPPTKKSRISPHWDAFHAFVEYPTAQMPVDQMDEYPRKFGGRDIRNHYEESPRRPRAPIIPTQLYLNVSVSSARLPCFEPSQTSDTAVTPDDNNDSIVAPEPEERLRIILKFKIPPAPNPVPMELKKALKKGTILDSRYEIRSELLHDAGSLPEFIGCAEDYEAISHAVSINQDEIRKKVNAVNRACPQSSKRIKLNKEYDRLLELQIPSLTQDTQGNSDETTDDETKDKVFVQKNGIIYLKIEQREFQVQRSAIVIPKISDEEVKAILAPPRGFLLSSAVNNLI